MFNAVKKASFLSSGATTSRSPAAPATPSAISKRRNTNGIDILVDDEICREQLRRLLNAAARRRPIAVTEVRRIHGSRSQLRGGVRLARHVPVIRVSVQQPTNHRDPLSVLRAAVRHARRRHS